MLNPDMRKAIYALVAAVLTLFSVLHIIDAQTAEALGDVADKLIAAAVMLLAFRNVKPAVDVPVPPAEVGGE